MPQGRKIHFRGTTLITAYAVTLQGSNKPPAMVTGQAVVAYYHTGFGTLLGSQNPIRSVPPSQQRWLSETLG